MKEQAVSLDLVTLDLWVVVVVGDGNSFSGGVMEDLGFSIAVTGHIP